MAIKLKNNAITTIAINTLPGDLTITVTDGSVFPGMIAGDWFYATLINQSDDTIYEIVKVTSISVNTLTVERSSESTIALGWAPGDFIEQRATAQTLYDLMSPTGGAEPERDYLDEIRLSLGGGSPAVASVNELSNKSKRNAPVLVDNWDTYYGKKLLNTITEQATGNVLADEIGFDTLADIITWCDNNLPATNVNAIIMKPYERINTKIPQMTKMYGLNRFYSAIKGKRNYTTTKKDARDSKLDDNIFLTMFNVAHGTAISTDPLIKRCTWVSNNKKNLYSSLHRSIIINHMANNGGNGRSYFDFGGSSYGTLSSGEEDFHIIDKPIVAYLSTSGGLTTGRADYVNNLDGDLDSKLLVYPLNGDTSTYRSVMVKPLGVDSFVMEIPDFINYTLEAVAFNDHIQSGIKVKEFTQYSDFNQSDQDPVSGKMRIDKVNFKSLMATMTQLQSMGHYNTTSNYNTIRFRLRSKSTGEVGKLSKFGIVYEALHQYNTFRYMIKNFN